MAKILVADDEPTMRLVLTEVLTDRHHEVLQADSAERAYSLVQETHPDLVLADIEMPQGKPTGLELLAKIKDYDRTLPVVMITAQGTKERVIAALRAGAEDFIEKPFAVDELVKRIENALERKQAVALRSENMRLRKELEGRYHYQNMIGNSPQMEAVYRIIQRVADTDSTVLILGESGTGKELVARALHYASRRAHMPFVAVNCAALPEHLLESELFGHRKGAFTGAAFDKKGLFQDADGGTIFLDEIGSMPLGLQSKLLRFLQDKELRRVGDTQLIKVDVRVIAATNEPLQQRLKEKSFREDLYYRISVIPIELPPLRERVEDIPLLVHHFLQELSKRQGVAAPRLGEGVLEVLQRYRWPGNVRELQNAIERAFALCDGGVIELKDLPERVLQAVGAAQTAAAVASSSAGVDTLGGGLAKAEQWSMGVPKLPLREFLHRMEVGYIEQAIRAAGGDKEKAAQWLGISMATLYRKLAAPVEATSPAPPEVPPATG